MAYTGVALLQNINALPFTNERLAASVGKSAAEFNAAPVSEAAVNVVFDALAESKNGLVAYAVIDERRAAAWSKCPVSTERDHSASARSSPCHPPCSAYLSPRTSSRPCQSPSPHPRSSPFPGAAWLGPDGGFDVGAYSGSLAKAQALVVASSLILYVVTPLVAAALIGKVLHLV